MRLTRIATCLANGAALPQQIPALIELDLDRRQPLACGWVKRSTLEKLVLFRDQVLDMRQNHFLFSLIFHEMSSLLQ